MYQIDSERLAGMWMPWYSSELVIILMKRSKTSYYRMLGMRYLSEPKDHLTETSHVLTIAYIVHIHYNHVS